MSIDIKKITGHESKIEKKTFFFTPFSPLFIGSGQKFIKGLDFVSQNNKTYQLDLTKLFRDRIEDLDKLESAIKNANIPNYTSENGIKISQYVKQSWYGDSKSNELLEPVSDGFGIPIIPGSSFKGSMRTALFASFLKEKKLDEGEYRNLITKRDGKSLPVKWASQSLQKELLTTYHQSKKGSSPNYDIGRAFRISDIKFNAENLEVFNVAVLNETNNGFQWSVMGGKDKNVDQLSFATKISLAGISFDEEITKPQKFDISINRSVLEAIEWRKPFDFKIIADSCNQLSKKILVMDLSYLDDAKNNFSELSVVIDDLEEILETVEECMIENEKGKKLSWIQRIGWGSGWLTMTGAHTHDDYIDIVKKAYPKLFKRTGPFEFPKTRKIVLDRAGKPATTMGWVLIEEQ